MKLPPLIMFPQYDTLHKVHTMKRVKMFLKSKTVWGAVLGAAAYLLGVDHIGIQEVAQAAGPVLAAVGIRDALPARD